jgi:hypothetical protein
MEVTMAVNETVGQQRRGGESRLFAVRFLEKGPELNVPEGHYDPEVQAYCDLDGKPVFVDEFLCTSQGSEITTHHTTNVSGSTFSDPDNG